MLRLASRCRWACASVRAARAVTARVTAGAAARAASTLASAAAAKPAGAAAAAATKAIARVPAAAAAAPARKFGAAAGDHGHGHGEQHDDHHHAHEMTSYLAREEVVERVMEVLKRLGKLKQEALTETAHFSKDLGLDSLDTVETVVALEEEFGAVLPDDVAEQIESVKDVIEVLCAYPNLPSIHAVH